MTCKTVAERLPKSKQADLFSYAISNRPASLYKVTNNINGKFYLGVTRLTPEKRFSRHVAEADRGSNRNFCRAIRKFGRQSFSVEKVGEYPSFKEALVAERAAIADQKPAYNTTAGGWGVIGLRHSAASRKKMAAAKNGKGPWEKGSCPPYVRQKLAEAGRKRKGEKRTGVGLLALQKNAAIANDARRRRVLCKNTGRCFSSVTEAANFYNVNTGHVTNWCKGVRSRKGISLQYL